MIKNIYIILFLLPVYFSSCTSVKLQNAGRRLDKETILASKNFKEKIKFRFGDFIYIPVTINGEPDSREFVLDTGSPCFITFATRNTISVRSEIISGEDIKMEYCNMPLKIANVSYSKTGCLVMDYNNKQIKGVAGVNLMKNLVWTFDFRDSTIAISDTARFTEGSFKAARIDFKPLSAYQQTPVIKLVVNGGDTIEAMLDTGYPGFLKLNSSFDISKIKGAHPDEVATYTCKPIGFDSTFEQQDLKLDLLKAGNWEGKNLVAERSDAYDGDNLLGLSFLKNFVVTIDWKHNNIYLQPITNVTTFNEMSFGFKCDTLGKRLLVTAVVRNSYADIEKLQPGDEIEMINNVPAANMTMKAVGLINDGTLSNNLIVLKVKNNPNSIELKKYNLFKK